MDKKIEKYWFSIGSNIFFNSQKEATDFYNNKFPNCVASLKYTHVADLYGDGYVWGCTGSNYTFSSEEEAARYLDIARYDHVWNMSLVSVTVNFVWTLEDAVIWNTYFKSIHFFPPVYWCCRQVGSVWPDLALGPLSKMSFE